MGHKALNIAKYIVNYFIEQNNPINNLQLNKILYLIQIDLNCKLIKEDFEAWSFGPVIPDVYYFFKDNGANTIKRHYPVELNDETQIMLEGSLSVFHNMTAGELVTICHNKNSSWDIVYKEDKNNIIPKGLMKKDKIIKEFFIIRRNNENI